MVPLISRLLNPLRIISTAAWSASLASLRPTHSEAAIAVASLIRANSRAKIRIVVLSNKSDFGNIKHHTEPPIDAQHP